MPLLTGKVSDVTGTYIDPSEIVEVVVKAPSPRVSGGSSAAVIVTRTVPVTVGAEGALSFNMDQGVAVLVVKTFRSQDTYKMVVTEDMTTIREAIIQASGKLPELEQSQLIELAEQVRQDANFVAGERVVVEAARDAAEGYKTQAGTYLAGVQANADAAAVSEGNAEQFAEDAESSATAASGSASAAATSANNAANSASAASGSATAAGDSAAAASGSAGDAEDSAGAANVSAEAASVSASEALGYRNQTLTYRNDAEGFASSASVSATTATNAASAASGSASAAATSESNAAGHSGTASGFATTAGGHATTASGHASAAAVSAGEAEDAADLAQSYAEDFGLTVSGTTTSAEGTDAVVTVSGSGPEYSLSFTIPRGSQGPKGDDGEVSQAMLEDAVEAVIAGAPDALDTLHELAAALGNDPNFATTVSTQIAGKAAVEHGHVLGDVTGLESALDGKAPSSHTHDWASVTGKPAEFTPAAHSHAQSDVTGLSTALAGKAGLSHSHVIGDVTGLQSAIDVAAGTAAWASVSGKPSTFTPSSHSHAWSEVTDKPSTFTPASHGHPISEVTGLQTALDGKAGSSHTHSIANVTGLQSALDGKAATSTVNARPALFSGAGAPPSTIPGAVVGDWWLNTSTMQLFKITGV